MTSWSMPPLGSESTSRYLRNPTQYELDDEEEEVPQLIRTSSSHFLPNSAMWGSLGRRTIVPQSEGTFTVGVSNLASKDAPKLTEIHSTKKYGAFDVPLSQRIPPRQHPII